MNKNIYTFWELLNEHPVVIPQIQRDYAYGRDDEKAKSVCNNLLSSFQEVLTPDSLEEAKMVPLTLDFVYGSIRGEVDLNPLDGQQRLTTLFLLHLYAAVKENRTEEKKKLKKFYYETRQSANNFCHNLIDVFMLKADSSKPLSCQIMDSPKYLPSFKADPTISSMLVVLDRISERFSGIANLWEKLTNERRIIFYFHELGKFGLSDDLYIKMNSRGKSLTNYELYKSDFLEFLKLQYPGFKDKFSDKLDTIWTDILWKHAELDTKGNRNIRSVDDGFMNLFSNVSVMLYHVRTDDNFSDNNGKDSKHLVSAFDKQFTSEDEINTLYNIFTLIEKALTDDSMSKYKDGIFYQNDTVKGGNSDKIRIFWGNKENIFILPFRSRLTREQMIIFYAIYIGIQNNLDDNVLIIRLRHLRNLVENSKNELRGNKIHGMLTETEAYITSGEFPSTGYFNSLQINEEKEKDKLPNWKDYWEYEDHEILHGSLGLFIMTHSLDQLEKFSSLFDEQYKEHTQILRLAFLIAGKDGTDYFQYGPYMDQPKKTWKRRILVNNPSKWSDFFIRNNIRRNQDAIINCLRNLPGNIQELDKYVSDGLQKLSKKSWKYYMVKYPNNANTVAEWTYGIYHWDDLVNRPLEAIMLNSQDHSPSNIEWNILNLTLRWQEEVKERCDLDKHGSSPLKLVFANSNISATQDGWVVSTYEGHNILENLKNAYGSDSAILDNGDGTSSVTIPVAEDTDYIIFGKELIMKIEELYSKFHENDNAEEIKTEI